MQPIRGYDSRSAHEKIWALASPVAASNAATSRRMCIEGVPAGLAQSLLYSSVGEPADSALCDGASGGVRLMYTVGVNGGVNTMARTMGWECGYVGTWVRGIPCQYNYFKPEGDLVRRFSYELQQPRNATSCYL